MRTKVKFLLFLAIIAISTSCAKKMDQVEPVLLQDNLIKSTEITVPDSYTLVDDFLFIREKGKPFWETKSFAISHYAESVMIKLINGPENYYRVSSANILINNQEVFVEHDFNQQVGYLEFDSSQYDGNELKVMLNSKPNSAIGIAVYEKRVNLNN